eukprot:Gb_14928 [translate_table: standard]
MTEDSRISKRMKKSSKENESSTETPSLKFHTQQPLLPPSKALPSPLPLPLPLQNNSQNPSKHVNWRLACFLANEYLSRGTLLGNDRWQHDKIQQEQSPAESRRYKQRLYLILMDFLRSEDVQIPGIVNPSQLAAWLGL